MDDQRQILDFAEFLWAKRQKVRAMEMETTPRSFLEAAQTLIGAREV